MPSLPMTAGIEVPRRRQCIKPMLMTGVRIDGGRDLRPNMIDYGGNDVDSPEPAKCLTPQDAPSSEDLALLKNRWRA
jgi:hypothetical protein